MEFVRRDYVRRSPFEDDAGERGVRYRAFTDSRALVRGPCDVIKMLIEIRLTNFTLEYAIDNFGK